MALGSLAKAMAHIKQNRVARIPTLNWGGGDQKPQWRGHVRVGLLYNMENPPTNHAFQEGLDDTVITKMIRGTDIPRELSVRTDGDLVTHWAP